MRMHWAILGMGLWAMIAWRAAGQGQAPGGPRPPMAPPGGPPWVEAGNEQEMQKLVEAVLAARLAETLGLTDEQTVVMVRRLGEFKEQIRSRKNERQKLVQDLKAALDQEAPDTELDARLNALKQHDAEFEQFKRGAYEKACENLTTAQRARLYVFLSEFESDIRRLVQRARARRGEHMGWVREPGASPGPEGRDALPGTPRGPGPSGRPFGERGMRLGPMRQRASQDRSGDLPPPPPDPPVRNKSDQPAP